MWKFILTVVFASLALAPAADASVLAFKKGRAWAADRDLSSAEFSAKFKQHKAAGLLLIDFDATFSNGAMRYAGVWAQNADKRGWQVHRDRTGAQYAKLWTSLKAKGYRPIDVESYRVGKAQRWAGIWVQNREKLGWASKRGMTAKAYGTYFKAQSAKGYRPLDIEVYDTAAGRRYASIWIENKPRVSWAARRDMSRSGYMQEAAQKKAKGYFPVDVESYGPGGTRYAVIWERRPGTAFEVRTGRTGPQWTNLWREYVDKGYRLVDFELSGSGYGGVWISNAKRFDYARKRKLDRRISSYQSTRGVTGLSVAVIRNGTTIYRRGFGWADAQRRLAAHGGTVYNAASVSKVIAGTLAVKLADEGRLRNGRKVKLDFSKTTRSYLTNVRQTSGTRVTLPSRHTHTVAQLFAHLGCLRHYSKKAPNAYSGPTPTTAHYVKAIDALPQIWNAPFLPGCTVGTNRSYSTHGFTYAAAVLEQVTGRTTAQLIRSELKLPYGLGSMRAQWGMPTLLANAERAVPYNDNGNATSNGDNSWKVFGGGIEVSAVDLARFGWKVLAGEIVRAKARDDVLWTRVRAGSSNGIGWSINTRSGRRVADHGGSWSGSRTYLRVFRDDGLVVAVMSNTRRGHSSGDVANLVAAIANDVLAPARAGR